MLGVHKLVGGRRERGAAIAGGALAAFTMATGAV